jgi:hypothetical protein
MTTKEVTTFDVVTTPLLPGVTFDPNVVTAERDTEGSIVGTPGLTDLALSFGERMTDDTIGQGIAAALLVDDHGWRITKPTKADKDGNMAQSIPVLLGCSDGTASKRVYLGRYVLGMGESATLDAARAAASLVEVIGNVPKRTAALAATAGVEVEAIKDLSGEDLAKVIAETNSAATAKRAEQRRANVPTGPRNVGGADKRTEVVEALKDGPFVELTYPRWIKVRHENLTVAEHALMVAGVITHGLDMLAGMGLTLAEANALAEAEDEPTPAPKRTRKVPA